jgi:hypothetical protein
LEYFAQLSSLSGSIYEGGVFNLTLTLPMDYPWATTYSNGRMPLILKRHQFLLAQSRFQHPDIPHEHCTDWCHLSWYPEGILSSLWLIDTSNWLDVTAQLESGTLIVQSHVIHIFIAHWPQPK